MARTTPKPKKQRCYIYTRVSTQMQVEGFSLDAQRNRLLEEAEHKHMEVAGEFSDEGKSGKNVTGRPQFQAMMRRIKSGNPDGVTYVYVFKLSRFGRNAADVLNCMQDLRDYNVNLLCVEDGLDSSTATGRIMVTILAAVAEMERENIQDQAAAGMEQKAREGLWGGGQAPFGYKLDSSGEGRLLVDEDEAPIVRLIYDRYVNTTAGYSGVAKWLNRNGYRRKPRQNGRLGTFTADIVKNILDNPAYAGKIVHRRFTMENIEGTRGETRHVKHDKFQVFDGQHEALVSQETWDAARAKREATAGKPLEHYGPKYVHVLSGLIKCPGCGSSMYGFMNRRKRKDGAGYTELPYYICKHARGTTGTDCPSKLRVREEILDAQVYEVVRQAIENTRFIEDMAEAIGKPDDLDRLSAELEALQADQRAAERKKARLLDKIMELDPDDGQYDAMYGDLQGLLRKQNEIVSELDAKVGDAAARVASAKADATTPEQIIAACRAVMDKIGELGSEEARGLMRRFVDSVAIYPAPLPSGQIVRSIKFRFPVTLDGSTFSDVFDYDEDNEAGGDGPEPPTDGGNPSVSGPAPDGGGEATEPGISRGDDEEQHANACTPNPKTGLPVS